MSWWRSRLLLTPADVATILSVSRSRVARLIARGELETRTVDGVRLVTVESLVRRFEAPAPTLAADRARDEQVAFATGRS